MRKKKFTWVDDYFTELLSEKPSLSLYVKRLKKHKEDMKDVYEEIETSLEKLTLPKWTSKEESALDVMDAIIEGAAYFNPAIAAHNSQREIRKELLSVEKNIMKDIRALCDQLRRRDELNSKGIVKSQADLNVFHLIDGAAHRDPSMGVVFDQLIAPKLRGAYGFEVASDSELYYEYDESHYPDLRTLLEEVITQFEKSNPMPLYPDEAAVISINKDRKLQDFIRYLYSRIEKEKGIFLPKDFKLSHNAMLKIIESVFDLKGLTDLDENKITLALRPLKKN